MKEAQKKFLGAALAVSSIVGVVAPSVTAMATVIDDEEKATPDQLKSVINEYSVKLEKNPIFANYHRVKYAAERLAQYDEQYSNNTLNSIAKYDSKVYTRDIVKLVDKMNEFSISKEMEIYDELINDDISLFAKTDKESANYLLSRLDVWGKSVVFDVDPNYSNATDAIEQVNTLREKDKLEEALDQVDVAKKAIKNILTYEINGKYLEGKLKIEEDKVRHDIVERDLYVREVSAINAREIKVTFNKAVSKDSAEDESNYKFKAANTDGVSSEIKAKDIELQDDNKSVIIKLIDKNDEGIEEGNALNNKTKAKYLVTISDVLTDDDEELKEYSEIIGLYDDVKPEVTDIEYRDADTVRINFSEPVRLDGMKSAVKIKLDGATVTLPSKAITKDDDDRMYIEISRSEAGLDSDKTYDLEIDGLTDYAGNALVKYTSDILFKKDTVDPEVEKIEALSENAFRVTFSEKITNIDIDGNLKDEGIFKVSTDSGRKVKEIKHNEKDDDRDYKTFVVKLDKNSNGNDLITISNFEDLSENDGESKTLEVKFEESNPVLESTTPEYKTIDGDKYAVYTFDRDVKVGSDNTVEVKHVDSDGVTKTNYPEIKGSIKTEGAIEKNSLADDKLETNEIAVKIDDLEEGEYNFDLEKRNVQDEYDQNVEKINLEFTKGDKGIKFDVDTIATYQYIKNDKYEDRYDNDRVVVTFKNQLTKQGVRDAAKAKNYRIDGKLAVEKAEVLEGKKTVELTLKKDEITTNVDERIVEISGIDGVKDYNEKVKIEYTDSTNKVLKTGIFENEKPVIDKAEAIAYDTIKLTMSEKVKTTKENPFEVKVGDKIKYIETEKNNGVTINGNVITIKVENNNEENPFDTSSKITVKVFDDYDEIKPEEGQYVQDLSGNRAEEIIKEVDKKFDMKLVEAIEAVNKLKAIENPTDKQIQTAQDVVDKLSKGSTDKINLQKEIDEIKSNKYGDENTKLDNAVKNIGEVTVDSSNNNQNLKDILAIKANNSTTVDSIDSVDAKLDGVVNKEGKITPSATENKTGDVKVTLKYGDTTKEATIKVTVNETTAPTVEKITVTSGTAITIKFSEKIDTSKFIENNPNGFLVTGKNSDGKDAVVKNVVLLEDGFTIRLIGENFEAKKTTVSYNKVKEHEVIDKAGNQLVDFKDQPTEEPIEEPTEP